MKVSALRKGCDNLTVVMIAFEHFEKLIQNKSQLTQVKEDNIIEVLLPPLVEQNDMLDRINDLNELIAKA